MMAKNNQKELLKVTDLQMHFPVRRGAFSRVNEYVYAVDGVSFSLKQGETLGLVGESGCGKTTVGRCIVRLYEPSGGQILFDGKDYTKLPRNKLSEYRSQMQMIFQDPYSSLNPRMRIQEIIGEPLRVYKLVPNGDWKGKVEELLDQVGLRPSYASRYPHEFSGGQRQRIGIARALAMKPRLIVADEPVSALDASIQAQVINILANLKEQLNLSYLFVSHDIAVVEHVSDRIAVMYLGKLVEIGSDQDIIHNAKHPYTKALLSAVPVAGSGGKERLEKRIRLSGDVPSPMNPPSGCHFHTRCLQAMEKCSQNIPPTREICPGHTVNCFLYV